jgi:hypothetical protein
MDGFTVANYLYLAWGVVMAVTSLAIALTQEKEMRLMTFIVILFICFFIAVAMWQGSPGDWRGSPFDQNHWKSDT